MIRIILLVFLLLLPNTTYATQWCEDANCQGCWLVEHGSGEVLFDKSSNNNDGDFIAAGQPAWSATVPASGDGFEGTSNYSVDCDGVDDRIELITIGDISGTMSVGVWILPDTMGENSQGRIWDDPVDSGHFYGAFQMYSTNSLAFTRDFNTADGGWNIDDNDITLTSWNHIFVTYDDSSVNNDALMYVDGVSKNVSEVLTPEGTAQGSNFDLQICNRAAADRSFDGHIDELVIFTDIKDSTDINDIMDNGLYEYGVTNWCDDASSVVCLPFDGSEANSLLDLSGNSNDLTNQGADFTTVGCQRGQCYDFVLENTDWMYAADSASIDAITDAITLMLWVKMDDATSTGMRFIDKWDGSDTWILQNTNGELNYRVYFDTSGLDSLTSTVDFDTNFNHIAATYDDADSDTMVYYINGVADETDTHSSGGNLSTNNNTLNLGTEGSGQWMDGLMDEVGIFDKALDSTDINDIMDNGLYYAAPSTGGYFMGIY